MNDAPADGLADVTYWGGRYEDDAHAQLGGERIAQYGADGPHGWLDLPLAEAAARAAELTAWRDRFHGKGLMVSIEKRTDFHRGVSDSGAGKWSRHASVREVVVDDDFSC
ncbi:hypothetical protein [Streptomyces sp. LN549]|uniref:hypothetical protein n=1 Tax=Streptomyces sp. LN549 TaxID=3112979 RepID=UPI003715AB22